MIPLTIVIPTFNRAASLAETLGLLNQQDADPWGVRGDGCRQRQP